MSLPQALPVADSEVAGLDIAGFVPGFGEIADGVNAVIYLAEGRYAEAAISAAAMIPIVGDAGKAAKWGVKAGKKALGKGAGKAGKQATKEVAKEAAERGGKELAEESAERVGKEAVEEGAEKGAKYISEELAEREAREAVEEAAEQVGKETAEAGAEKAGKEAAEEGAEKAAKKESACVPKFVPHRGGNVRHNTCADRIPPNVRPGYDAKVRGVAFDALNPARTLWEIKTNNYSRYPPPKKKFNLKDIVLAAIVAQAGVEFAIATSCGYGFVLAVTDAELYTRLQKDLFGISVQLITGC